MVNLQNLRHKYFRALNGLLGKIDLNTDNAVLTLSSLIETHCISILLYGWESLVYNKSMLATYENAYQQAYMKLLKTFDKNIIFEC